MANSSIPPMLQLQNKKDDETSNQNSLIFFINKVSDKVLLHHIIRLNIILHKNMKSMRQYIENILMLCWMCKTQKYNNTYTTAIFRFEISTFPNCICSCIYYTCIRRENIKEMMMSTK